MFKSKTHFTYLYDNTNVLGKFSLPLHSVYLLAERKLQSIVLFFDLSKLLTGSPVEMSPRSRTIW